MELTLDQQSQSNNFKHFCKICKKGFLCGRALGGHMRAHGIGEEDDQVKPIDDDYDHDHDDEEGQASDWEDKLGGGGGGHHSSGNKQMYWLRENPNKLRNCRACENCGKEFSSWKSFLEHGKYCRGASEYHEESLLSSPRSGFGGEDGVAVDCSTGWSKRKRSFRAKVGSYQGPSSEEEDLANCLVMLSNATFDPFLVLASRDHHRPSRDQESSASAGRDHEEMMMIRPRNINPINFIDTHIAARPPLDRPKSFSNINKAGLFECKACKKVFNSHQALGGHRASHKKVKGCYAARLDHVDQDTSGDYQDGPMINNDPDSGFRRSTNSMVQFDHPAAASNLSRGKSKVHECSICHRTFLSGQALGGHKRCHWITSTTNSPDATTSSSATRIFQLLHGQSERGRERPRPVHCGTEQALDLNFPATKDDLLGVQIDPRHHLSLKVSTSFCFQSWGSGVEPEVAAKEKQCLQQPDYPHKQQDHEISNGDDNVMSVDNKVNYHDQPIPEKVEAREMMDSEVKLAKLSGLEDVNTTGGSSPWLQVGIGSSNNGTIE